MLWSASGRSSGVLLEISGIPLGRFLGFLEPLVALSGSLLPVSLVVNFGGVLFAHGAPGFAAKIYKRPEMKVDSSASVL